MKENMTRTDGRERIEGGTKKTVRYLYPKPSRRNSYSKKMRGKQETTKEKDRNYLYRWKEATQTTKRQTQKPTSQPKQPHTTATSAFLAKSTTGGKSSGRTAKIQVEKETACIQLVAPPLVARSKFRRAGYRTPTHKRTHLYQTNKKKKGKTKAKNADKSPPHPVRGKKCADQTATNTTAFKHQEKACICQARRPCLMKRGTRLVRTKGKNSRNEQKGAIALKTACRNKRRA